MSIDSFVVARWASRRAWSRAGAIADVLSAGAPRRVLLLGTRIVLLVFGSVLIAAAVAALLWNDFGPGPLDVFIVGLRNVTGLPLAIAVWAAFALMVMLALALGRRPGPGTVLAPLIIGPAMQSFLDLYEHVQPVDGWLFKLVVQISAVGVAGIGAGALVVAGLGAGTGELLAMAASDRFGRPMSPVRLTIELGWLLIGVLLGGPIGVGTIVVAFLIGPAVGLGHRGVDRAVGGSRLDHVRGLERRETPPTSTGAAMASVSTTCV